MNQAIMAIELYDVSWTFGAFAFENVVIVSVLPLRIGADVESRVDREHLLDCVVHQRADQLQQRGQSVHLEADRDGQRRHVDVQHCENRA
jgi:hypothetical protein